WQLCTLIGIIAGQSINEEQARNLGLDFAMVVTFIGIVVPLVRSRPVLLSVTAAGLCALIFNGLPNQMGLMVAALAGIVAGYVAETVMSNEMKVEGEPSIK
ncbi:MAG: branched-chain amino acid ABC transporter permease, partial [Chitinophagaceae bacterium]|nr:branched-chain amino acid ABC transporter permease [Anaerolineae bacterium]